MEMSRKEFEEFSSKCDSKDKEAGFVIGKCKLTEFVCRDCICPKLKDKEGT